MDIEIEKILSQFNQIFIEVLDEDDIELSNETTADDIMCSAVVQKLNNK